MASPNGHCSAKQRRRAMRAVFCVSRKDSLKSILRTWHVCGVCLNGHAMFDRTMGQARAGIDWAALSLTNPMVAGTNPASDQSGLAIWEAHGQGLYQQYLTVTSNVLMLISHMFVCLHYANEISLQVKVREDQYSILDEKSILSPTTVSERPFTQSKGSLPLISVTVMSQY